MPRFHWIVSLSLAFSACAKEPPADLRPWTPEDHGQPAEADPSRIPSEAPANQPPSPERAAAALWKVACAGCHGLDGHGGGSALPPGANVPDFTDPAWQASRSDTQLSEVIRNGRNLMPPFGAQVTEDGIAAIVGHVRTLRR